MKKALLFVGAFVVLGLLAFIFLIPSSPESMENASSSSVAQTPAVPAAEPITPEVATPEAATQSRSNADISAIAPAAVASIFDRNAIYGTVLDAANKPIAGATVALYSEGGWDWWNEAVSKAKLENQATSGEDGRFKMPATSPFASFRLLATAPSYAPAMMQARPGKDLKVSMQQAAMLAGEIRDLQNKQPVAGAKISYRYRGLQDNETTSGADGKFRIPFPVREQISLFVAADGYARQRFPLTMQAGETKEKDLALRKGTELAGQIYDVETNQPIAGAEIEGWGQKLGRSDESGHFRIPAMESTNASIAVHAPGYCSLSQELAGLSGGELELPLTRGAEIEGRVRDREGKPIANAPVRVSLQGGDEEVPGLKNVVARSASSAQFLRGPRSRSTSVGKNKPPRGGYWQDARGSQQEKTDAEGRFHLRGLMPASAQTFSVTASHPDYCEAQQEGIKLAEPGQKAFAELVLTRGAALEGRVTSGERSVASAQVWIQGDGTWRECATNDEGEFGFEHLAEGAYKIGVNPEGMQDWGEREGGESVPLQEGERIHKDLKLDATALRPISGRVLASDGKPVPNARVNAWATLNDNRYVNREGKSLADGSFRIELPDSGNTPFQVSAWDGANWASQSKIPLGSENVEIRFPALGKLRLRVLDARNHDPVSSFQVLLRDSSGKRTRSMSLTTDATGFAEMDTATGIYDLSITASSQGFRSTQIPGVEISQKASDPLNVELLPGVKLSLHIVSAEGASLGEENHWISLSPVTIPGAPKTFPGNQGAPLDETGKCTISGVTPGKFRLHVNPSDIVLEPNEIEVLDQEASSFEIHWKPKPEEKPKGE